MYREIQKGITNNQSKIHVAASDGLTTVSGIPSTATYMESSTLHDCFRS